MNRSVLRRPLAAVLLAVLAVLTVSAGAASAESYVPISGAGSTWSQNAIDQWRRNVNQYGMRVDYQGTGSSDGRNQFRNGTVDFAVSEIPYGLTDGGVPDAPPQRGYAYMPIVAGGTSFMYNLKIGGRRVTNLRLSGENVTKIFTGVIRRWNDTALQKDNPGLALPARQIVPVVRSDGSGTTAQFTTYMAERYQSLWDAYCRQAGRSTPCGSTSNYPVVPGTGMVAQSGSLGVSGYVTQAQSEGAITYVEYSYAINSGFPVAKVLNAAGYYTEPTAQNVAVALLKARINQDTSSPRYLTQILSDVYGSTDARTYPLSSYSYMILPTKVEGSFNDSKGKTLGAFAYYFLCEGQQYAPVLGFSPLPINLVQAGFDQVRKIPGVDAQKIDVKSCHNPTFSPSGQNTLAANAPQPQACDKAGPTQCTNGTGGAKSATTPVSAGGTAQGTGTPGGARAPSTSTGGPPVPGAVGGTAPSTTSAGVAAALPTAQAAGGAPAPQVAAGGPNDVVAVPTVLVARGLGNRAPALMGLAGLLVLLVALLPPLLWRRLRPGALPATARTVQR